MRSTRDCSYKHGRTLNSRDARAPYKAWERQNPVPGAQKIWTTCVCYHLSPSSFRSLVSFQMLDVLVRDTMPKGARLAEHEGQPSEQVGASSNCLGCSVG